MQTVRRMATKNRPQATPIQAAIPLEDVTVKTPRTEAIRDLFLPPRCDT